MVGRTVTVLVEGASRKSRPEADCWRGRDEYGQTVNVGFPQDQPARGVLAGKIISVRVDAAKKHSLFGEAIGEPW